jgi:hypothetical protein
MHQAGVGPAARDGHLERVDDELGAHVVGHAPADDPTAVGVLHGRQLQPALPGAQVGDVGQPQDVRRVAPEPALDEIVGDPDAGRAQRGRPRLRCTSPDTPAWRIGRRTRLPETRTPRARRSSARTRRHP